MRFLGSFLVIAALTLMLRSFWLGSAPIQESAAEIAVVIGSSLSGALVGHLVGFWIGYQPRDKRAAKRFNESVKLTANSLNALALAVIGAAVIIPLIRDNELGSGSNPSQIYWVIGALMAHVLAHAILGLMKSEDV